LCLPTYYFADSIFPYLDDLSTEGDGLGIFTSTEGKAPNRIFNIEWRARHVSDGGFANFTLRLYEASSEQQLDIVYGQVDHGGIGATVGVERTGSQHQYTQYECNTGGISPGLCLSFIMPQCATLTPTRTRTPSRTRTATPTITGSPY